MFRKVSFLCLAGLMFIFLVSCSSTATAAGTQEAQQPVLQGKVSAEDMQPTASIEQLTGKVEITGSGDTILVENWTSKSRKSYQVVGDMANILRGFEGKIVKADVIFLEKRTWSGAVVLVSFDVADSTEIPMK